MAKPVCVVAGVGPGNGAAFARRFDSEGYSVALLARGTELPAKLARELSDACAYACDVADAASVARAFEEIRRDLGDPEVLVYNAGSGVWGTVEDATPADFEGAWRVNALGGFLASKQVIPAMKWIQRRMNSTPSIVKSCRSMASPRTGSVRFPTLS